MGRIDQLVEAVHERFKDRYFEAERTFEMLCTSHLALILHPVARRLRRP